MVQIDASNRYRSAATVLMGVPVAGSAADRSADLPVWFDAVTALGPLIIVTGALVAATLAWSATRRERWWLRTQWAVDHVLAADPGAQVVGLAVLEVQVDRARSGEEVAVIGAVSDTLLEPLLGTAQSRAGSEHARYVLRPSPGTSADRASEAPSADPQDEPDAAPRVRASSLSGPTVVPVSRVERDAARLRLHVDRRLRRPSAAQVDGVAGAAPD